MNKSIKEMSVVELKALGYDLVAQFENIQNNLKIVNGEIASRTTLSQSQEDGALACGEEIKVEEKKEE